MQNHAYYEQGAGEQEGSLLPALGFPIRTMPWCATKTVLAGSAGRDVAGGDGSGHTVQIDQSGRGLVRVVSLDDRADKAHR